MIDSSLSKAAAKIFAFVRHLVVRAGHPLDLRRHARGGRLVRLFELVGVQQFGAFTFPVLAVATQFVSNGRLLCPGQGQQRLFRNGGLPSARALKGASYRSGAPANAPQIPLNVPWRRSRAVASDANKTRLAPRLKDVWRLVGRRERLVAEEVE